MKKKSPSLFLALLILIGWPVLLTAATVVDSTLSGAVTWTQDKSPYLVRRDTRLMPGSRLVVYPGVVVEVDTTPDESIPGGTPNVDFIVQGNLQIIGSDFAPVSMVSARPPFKWGALYVLPPEPAEWTSFHLLGGQLVLSNGSLTLNTCRISQGKGIGVGPRAALTLNDCQVDENTTGLSFWDPSATVSMNHTRMRQNEVGLQFKAAGTLKAADSSVYDSTQFHAVNETTETVGIPSLWWGTADAGTIMQKIRDGHTQPGHGMFRFSRQSASDPMLTSVKGFDPGKDPNKLYRHGPRIFLGPLLQAVFPRLSIPSSEMDRLTVGYGLQAGFVLTGGIEVRGTVQSTQFSAKNTESRSNLQMDLLRMGLLGRKSFPLGKQKRAFLFGEAGGLIGMTQEDLTRPRDPWDVTSPLINKKIRETNMNLTVGAGTEFLVGNKHRIELGVHYEMVPLNDSRGGALILIQGALNLYF